jgi:N-acetyl-beta-hexosaminidase
MENVLAETLELFPSEFIHIGGDEASKAFWSKCKFCQQRKTTEKLANEHELQSYFIKRMEKYLNSKGRRLIGWNEILEGGLAPNATVMSWQGTRGGVIAARAGHDVVMSPEEFIYFDHPESNAPGYPMSWGSAISSLETVYNYEPIPSELTAEEAKHVLGAQANMWTVYTHTDESIEFMTYPRLCALAEITWTNKANRNWKNFQNRMETHFKRLDAMGVTNFRDATVKIGKWKSAEMSETYKSISYDITDILKKEGAGKYDVLFQYTGGAHMLRIEWTAIYEGQTQLSRDEHPGFTGASHENNTYRLDIKTLSPGKKHKLTAWVRSDGGTDSNGVVSIRKAPK